MKHTKGNWEVRGNRIFIGCTHKSVATVEVQKNYEDITFKPIKDVEAEANAKLIAAAPDLLLALDELTKQLTGDQEDEEELEKGLGITLSMRVQHAKMAIKKATE